MKTASNYRRRRAARRVAIGSQRGRGARGPSREVSSRTSRASARTSRHPYVKSASPRADTREMGDFLTEHLRANPQQAPDEDQLRTLRPGAARSYGHAQMLARLLDYADRAN